MNGKYDQWRKSSEKHAQLSWYYLPTYKWNKTKWDVSQPIIKYGPILKWIKNVSRYVRREKLSSSDHHLKGIIYASSRPICYNLDWDGNSPVHREIQQKEFSPFGSILIWKSQRKHCLICRNGSARECDKWNEKDRKDTSRIHSLKLKPLLFLIFNLGI